MGTRPPRKPAATVHRARQERKRLSPAEVKLWCELRERPGGFKFRKQHPAGPYSIDFYCAEAKLAIEVDGAFHDRGDAPAFDAARDAWLARYDVATMRIPARELYRDINAVVIGIIEAVRLRLPLHHSPSASGPPPQAELGEN
jgi:very-short-patch-repair endonuclease